MKNNKIRSFFQNSRFIFIVAFLFFSFFLTQSASAAGITWDNTSGDGLWNTATNWSSDTVPGASDTAIFAVSNTTNCTVNINLTIGGFQIDSGYSGAVDLSTYTMSTGALTLNGGTLEATNSTSITASSYAQTGTSIFKAPVSLTINNGNFTYTAGTFTHNNGTVNNINQGGDPRTFSANGLTLYNLVFDKTTTTNVSQSYITGTFTVNDFTLKNSGSAGSIEHKSSGTCVINVNGNLNFPASAGTSEELHFGSSGAQISVNLYGNLVMSDASSYLQSTINFVGAGAQTITQIASIINTGTWTINKASAENTVTLLTNLAGSMPITLTQGTFDVGIYTLSFTNFTLNGGIFQAVNSAGVMASSSAQSGTSVFNAPASFTINNGNFTYTAGTFTHNNGTVTYVNKGVGPQTFSANGLTLYDLVFDKTTTANISQSYITGTFTVNDFTLKNSASAGRIDHVKSGTCVINVNGDLNFPASAGTSEELHFGDSGAQILVNLYGNLVMNDASSYLKSNVSFVGAAAQTITRTAGNISMGTWTVNKTNFTDSVTQTTAVLTPNSLVVTKGIYDTGGYNLTAGGITVSAGSTFRLKGDEAVTAAPTFSASSTVEYYATSGSRAIKSWTHTTGTLKINGAGGVFTLPANSTISTTTISAGTLSLSGYNLTTTFLTNNSTLRRIGGETITVSTSTRSGTIEYVGDADGLADNYNVSNISNVNYHNLRIASTDSLDTYIFPATINISGNLTKTAGTISAASTAVTLSGTNQTVSVDAAVTVSAFTKVITTASDTLTFGTTGSLVITGTTTLQGTASYPLSLRSSTPDTQWLFDPQGARSFSYLNVQDSWNINALGINSPGITGFVNSGNNTNWGVILLPTVTSSAATSITSSTATFHGEITNTGGENNTVRGFEYGTTTAYGTATSTTGSYSTGIFSANLTGLTSETTYHYRSFSTNSAGTSSSTDQSFITLDINSPVITITGANPAYVNQNAAYTDAGATASDTVDGNLTDSIVTTNNVDTAIVGNTSVIYTVTDSSDNSASSTRVVIVQDITASTFSAITSATTTSSATISWTTNESATSQVEYGPSVSYGDITTISDLSGTTTHAVAIPNLLSCTNYHYRVISADLSDNTATSSDYSFVIGGCTGDASVLASSTEETLTAEGGTVTLNELTLDIPADFTATTSQVVFQAKELAESEFFVTVTAPTDYTFIGNYIYNLKTLIDSTTTLPDFSLPLTITMTYDPTTLGSITESSLVIYRYDAPTWTLLSSCTVNTSNHTVTCTTTSFSDFGLFGQVAVATSVTSTTQTSGTHFGCKDPKATNYDFFSAHRQALCKYAPVATLTATPTQMTIAQFINLLIQIGVIAPDKIKLVKIIFGL